MAVGFGLSIDDKFLRDLTEADKLLDNMYNKSNKLKSSTVSAFKAMTDKGVLPFVDSLKKQKQMLEEIGNVKVSFKGTLFSQLQKEAKDTIDEINKVISTLEKTKNYKGEVSGRTALSFTNKILGTRGDKSINNLREALRQLEEAQNRQNLNTKRGVKNFEQLSTAIRQVKKELDNSTNASGKFNNANKGLLNTSYQLQRQLALLFSVSAIQSYIYKLVSVRKEFELQQKSLQILLQSKDEANRLWQQTIDLAVRSPFRVKELVTYTRQLAAYRIETNKLHDTTRRLSDVSAGLGVDMQRLILAFGQVRAANFLRGTELRQFTEAGIPMLDELAKHFTELEGKAISAGEVFEMISKRMVLFEDVEAVFRRMTSEGGAFFKMQEEQSKTLAGMISNLYDSVDLMLNEIGKTYDGFLKGSINFAKFFIENWGYMADAIKGVLLALAGHKLYQLALKQSILDTARAQGVLNIANAKQLTQLQLLRVGWNQLLASMKSSAATMKSMLVFNLPLLAVTALFSGVWKLISAWREHNEELDKISENYDDLRKKIEKINVSFNIATDENDIKTQKQKLNELIVMANNDYNMKIKVDVEGMDAREIQNKFSEISQQMFDANIFAEYFAKQMQRATEWVVEDDIFEDLEQLGNKANDVLHELSLNRERIVFDLQKSQDKLNESQREALEMLKQPKQIDESEVDYLERLSKGYSLVIDEYSTLQDALKNTKDASTASKLNVEFSKIQDTFKRLNIDASSLYKLFNNYDKTIEEARVEFENFAKTLDLNKNLTDEQKELRLKTAIDKLSMEKGWNDFVVNYIYRWTEEAFEIKFKPVISEEEPLKAWQETYNRLFSGMEGFREITKNTTKQKEIIDRLNGSIKETEELINRINKAGGIKATSKGGAYEGIDLSQLNNALLELKKQRDWLGGSESGKDKDSESKILKNRISLIKELNKEYEKLNKTFDATTSKEKVLESFGDTFKQAFEGTGISLSSMIVNTDALNDLKNTGELAGKTLSESMIKEIEQLKEAGTYIRNFDEDFLLSIKHLEGFRAEAYKDAGGVWTQGYGETINIERGKVWDEEKATMVLRDSLTKRYVSQLNEVLDDNKELVLTQKQYNALLDLTYQGGKGAAISILERTKDISKGVDYINLIASKIKETMGSKEAERFGEAFVNKFKEAESVYERIAMLLEVSNLTINGGINKEWYQGMQKRSDERASIFRGDLEASKILQEVLVSISDIDFTNIEGVIHQLKQLAPLAKKEGKEAELALSKAISELEVQVGVKKKSEQDKELIDYIEEMFSGYEMSIELQKLNIPPDLAKQLFNIDTLTLPELKNKVVSMESKFVGTNMEEEYRKFLEKIDEMEDKAQLERLKKYSQYLIKSQSERIKIKFEEMRQLAEIEDTFQLKENVAKSDTFGMTNDEWLAYQNILSSKKEINKETLEGIGLSQELVDKIIAYNEQMQLSKTLAMEGVKKETKEKLDKSQFDTFKESSAYQMLFKDAEYYSKETIKILEDGLKKVRSNLKNLGITELKELTQFENKLFDIKLGKNPFSELKDSLKEIQKLRKEGITPKTENKKILASEEEIAKLQRTLDLIDIIQKKGADGFNFINVEEHKQYNDLLGKSKEELADIVSTTQNEINKQKGVKKAAEDNIEVYNKAGKAAQAAFLKAKNTIEQLSNAYDSLSSMLDSIGVNMDESDNAVKNIGMGLADLLIQFAMIVIQAQLMGVAINAAMGPIGWIAMALTAVATILKGVFAAHDNALEKQIEREIDFVENLERAYKRLEKSIDNAYSIHNLEKDAASARRNIQSQIASYYRMIEAEEDKKKTDDDRIKEWRGTIEDLKDQLSELNKDVVSTATAGIMDSVLEASKEFTDAWLEAFNETGDGLSGLESNFKETMLEMVKQQAAMLISQAYVDRWKNQLEQYINPDDLELSTDEAKRWVNAVTTSLPQLNEALEKYFTAMQQAGVDLSGGTSGELSGLQRGIQSVTEETAQIIEAYLNSIRFFVAEQTTYLSQIASSFGNTEMENPMVEQLRIIASQTTAINTLLQSLTRGGHTLGGVGLKVFIS